MPAYAVKIESAPPDSALEPGAIAAMFETREGAEYFLTIAARLRPYRVCVLSVQVWPTPDRPRANER